MKTMKHLFGALPLVALALSFTACGNDETFGEPETTPAGKPVTMTFTARAADTRTSLVEGTQVYWTPNDVIGVYSCTSEGYSLEEPGSPFATDLTAAAPTATFTGEAAEGALQYIAVYPRDMFVACMWSSESTMLGFTLPPVQQAVAGGFATGLNPSLAMTDDMGGDLTFKNLCALVKFRISGGDADGLKSVTLTDWGLLKAGTRISLSGTATYWKLSGMEVVQAKVISVTLTGSFTTGTDYYFVAAPSMDNTPQPAALKNGFSLTFTRQDGTSFVKTASGGIGDTNLAAGTILDLGSIDLSGASYQKAITNLAFIYYAETSDSSIGWDKETSGTVVPLTEANVEKMKAVKKLEFSNTGLADISDIQYFTGLTRLVCNGNYLTELPVENLTNLTFLECSGNQLTGLSVGNLTGLTTLNCDNNHLTELDITSLTNLNSLACGNQTNAAGEPQTLKLILTSAQKDTWERDWKDKEYNANVTVEVKDLSSTAHW